MKYWGLLLAKLLASSTALWFLWRLADAFFPPPREPWLTDPFTQHLPYTMRAILFGLLGVGALFLVAREHRYRCRTCLRRLRMPVTEGSWTSLVLFGPPRTEYICPYGHGTLRVPEVAVSGFERARWKAHNDLWKELAKLEERKR